MSDSIYAPPTADVVVTASDEPEFYVVAPRKFYLLSVLTFNLYLVFWFYRNWKLIKESTGESLWPVPRGIFYIFFTHALFTDFDEKIKSLGRSFDWNAGATATLVVVLAIASTVLDRLSSSNIGSPATDLAGLVMAFVIPAVILQAQRASNIACDDPEGSTNANLTLANWAWMILGGLVWLLVFFGFYALLFDPALLEE